MGETEPAPAPDSDVEAQGCMKRSKDTVMATSGTGKSVVVEFRDFVLGGNLIRMAVAFVLALALERMISQFVASFITPILGIIGASDFGDLDFTIRDSRFAYGAFLDTLIAFLIICVVLFFCLILPVQRYGGKCVPSWIIRKCPYCFSDISAIATKCSHCCSNVEPLPAVAKRA